MSSPLEWISLLAMLLLAGGVSSYLVQKIKRAGWSSRTKYVLALGLATAVGLATVWLGGDILNLWAQWGDLTAAQVLAVLGSVYATATGWYELWFKTSVKPRA